MSRRKPAEQQRAKFAKTQILPSIAHPLDIHHSAPTPNLSHAIVQRTLVNPRTLSPNDILQLQRTVGNKAVQRMLNVQTKTLLQRSSQDGFEAGNDFEHELNRTKGRGSPLPKQTKREFEQSFGANFNDVRIHTDTNSNQLNRSIQAKAFTHGNDIHFGAGEFDPATAQGKKLLAHELTHTIQQTGGKQTKGVQTKLQVGADNDRYEQAADRVATQVVLPKRHRPIQPKHLQRISPSQGASQLPIQRKLDFNAAQLSGGDALSDKYYAKSGEQETYILLKQMLSRYHKSNNAMEQVRLLQQMNALATTWLDKHDTLKQTPGGGSKTSRFMKNASAFAFGESNKSKKSFSLHFLIQAIDEELPNAQQAAEKTKDDYAKKVDSGGMKYITRNGQKIFNDIKGWQASAAPGTQGAKASALMKQQSVHLAEASAIGIYSADDYKYMNPTVAKNQSWFHSQFHDVQFKDDQVGQEVIAGNPNKKPDGPITNMYHGVKFDQVKAATQEEMKIYHKHAAGAVAEATEHNEMALSGLNKLPDWQGTVYRGLTLTPAEFKQKYPLGGHAVMESFTSTSLREDVPSGLVGINLKPGKIGLILHMRLTKGKDIAPFTKTEAEQEVLLMPGATFKVVSITPTKTLMGQPAKKVVLQQIN